MSTSDLTVFRLGRPVSNAWLVMDAGEGPVLVDSGFSALWPAMLAQLRRRSLRPRDLRAVILTHRHCDHAANAARFWSEGVPVYAHRLDAECLMGQRPPPPLPTAASATGAMCWVENRFPARVERVRPLEDGDLVAGLRVRWVPGHTAGSVFLHHEPSATLFSGDALLNAVPPYTLVTRLSLPSPDFSEDYDSALASLERFAASRLEVRTVYCGHGPVWRGELGPALAKILARARVAPEQRARRRRRSVGAHGNAPGEELS
ncbi:MAG: MBL fold metallo-hydrolase [Myxococcales bacterium]|jgi:glyoxylase-like metal-dependent hydrolase (beta-lactamase superfamily II)